MYRVGLSSRLGSVRLGRLLKLLPTAMQESQLLPGVFHFRGSPSPAMADAMLDVAVCDYAANVMPWSDA